MEAATEAILFRPPIITSPTKIVMTIDVVRLGMEKLENNVLLILSIWGIIPEPNVVTNKQNAKMIPNHLDFKPFCM